MVVGEQQRMAKGGIALIFESKWASKPLGSSGFNSARLVIARNIKQQARGPKAPLIIHQQNNGNILLLPFLVCSPPFQSKVSVSKLTHGASRTLVVSFFCFSVLVKNKKLRMPQNLPQYVQKYIAALYYCEIYPCNGKVHHTMMSANACSLLSHAYKWLPIYMKKNTRSLVSLRILADLWQKFLDISTSFGLLGPPKTMQNFDYGNVVIMVQNCFLSEVMFPIFRV